MKQSVSVKNLSKAFRQYPSHLQRLIEWLHPTGRSRHRLNWVLKNINFTVAPGEAVGLIGINGAGKSTLLKIITGTSFPTQGMVTVEGRVAALLELGIGFQPQFTGRENVYLAGQLLGMKKDLIRELMPSIEEFAEIGDFIDQPTRIYSSGMQMRLAFSIATAVRPDVLIVDEALSVGDVYFQHKSFDRIKAYRNQGTALLIVSHDKQAIQSVCDRAILLDQGEIAKEGTPSVVFDYYNALLGDISASTVSIQTTDGGHLQTRSGTGEAEIKNVSFENKAGEFIDTLYVGDLVKLKISIAIHQSISKLIIGYLIKDRVGQSVFGTNTHYLNSNIDELQHGDIVEIIFDFAANLGPGSYSVTVALTGSENHLSMNYDWLELAKIFTVINHSKPHFEGSTYLENQVYKKLTRTCS
jgi:lipopolysaccharide transport system ATP-binding protein